MKPRYLTLSLALMIALIAAVVVYRFELADIRTTAAHTFEVRANLIRQYIRLMRHNVYAIEHSIESRYQQAQRSYSLAPELSAIQFYPRHNVWGISGLETEGGIAKLSGTLTGTEVLSNPVPALQQELTAVLETDHQFHVLLENVPDIIWVYYTSVFDFIYISPDPAIADFRFSPILRTKEYWAQAAPSQNPELRQIISDLYDDYYGQGLMISISSPVMLDGEFRGVASLDLGIELLRSLTGIGATAGQSILVDENQRIVARVGEFELSEQYSILPADTWVDYPDDAFWLSSEVAPQELRLLHKLPKSELYIAAAAASSVFWVVLAAMFGLVVFSVRLNVALSKVKVLMNRDVLTDLLNRRGFITSIKSLRQVALEKNHHTALLVLDIDHFKKVNDTYGHDIGDKVLTAIARRLSAGIKEYDLLCRWGGEELIVFLVYDDPVVLLRITERLRLAVGEQPITEHDLHVTISGGLTEWERDETLEAAVDRADRLMYAAKAAGRNRIEIGPSIQKRFA